MSALLTDSYQLSMIQGYLDRGMTEPAVFEFFVRQLPPWRNFLVAAGLEQALDYLLNIEFTAEELRWLESQGRYSRKLLAFLEGFRFTGEVWAMCEGEIFFANEPILRIRASLPQAQLVESRLINLLNFQTSIASKAARCRLAAGGRQLVDFGMRRAHGSEAALLAARASYLGGFDGTSLLWAGERWGIPVFGTMAHSFIEAHDDELVAFENFACSNPAGLNLLLDTYDTEAAARTVVKLFPRLRARGIVIRGVRLDSGDLHAHSRRVREILDLGGLGEVKILASGGVDEFAIRDLIYRGAPIDAFGVGTALTTSGDAPALDCAYKIQEYAGIARQKHSEGKATWPGAKQVFRSFGPLGFLGGDTLGLDNERLSGRGLLEQVMRDGRRGEAKEGLDTVRGRCLNRLAMLPSGLKSMINERTYGVEVSDRLRKLRTEVEERILSRSPKGV